MKSAVIVFPGSNCDRDAKVAIEKITGGDVVMQWHGDAEMPDVDFIIVPGGFSYGDYLRCGAIASNSPVMQEVKKRADGGVPVIGICNGFQVLTEVGLLPGILMRNADLKFVCRDVFLRVETTTSPFTTQYTPGQVIKVPGRASRRQLRHRCRHAEAFAGPRPGGVSLCRCHGGTNAGCQSERCDGRYRGRFERKAERAGHDAAP